jgi:putative protease
VLITPTDIQDAAPLKAGDGLVFDAADWRSPEMKEEGGHLYAVARVGDQLELRFGNREINFGRIRPGDWVWRTSDVNTARAAKPFTQATTPVYKQSLQVWVTAEVGQPLNIIWQLIEKPEVQVTVSSDDVLAPASHHGVTIEFLREQLGRLGNTAYRLDTLHAELVGEPFIPSSLLNRLRQVAVHQLSEQQAQTPRRVIHDPIYILEKTLSAIASQPTADTVQLHLLVRTPSQLEAALDLNPASITLDYLDLYGLSPAVEQIKAAGITPRVASPRVLKPQEGQVVNFLLRLDCQLVVRSGGLLEALQSRHQHALIGDFSLNAANQITADAYFNLGIDRITPTHDLNADQICRLAQYTGGARLEVIPLHHLPVFHTEHCVFCRFLSQGTSKLNCGQPCEKYRVALRDRQGRIHPVMADVGCRNTVFGAEAQEASRYLDSMMSSGIVHYRLEFVQETPLVVRQVTTAFQDYFAGRVSAAELGLMLQKTMPQGTTEGSLFVPI